MTGAVSQNTTFERRLHWFVRQRPEALVAELLVRRRKYHHDQWVIFAVLER
jgi:hypothetical protein